MKTTTSSLKFIQPALLSTLAIVILLGLSIRPAEAGYIVTLQEIGPDVVAHGSGAIDFTGLNLFLPGDSVVPQIRAQDALIITGATALEDFHGSFSGPTNFGPGVGFGVGVAASSGSGDLVGIRGNAFGIFVPSGYVSGDPLSDSAIYSGRNFSTLGVTPGTYFWTWGTGPNQNFTVQIGAATVPDLGSTFALLLVGLTGLFGLSRLRSRQLAARLGDYWTRYSSSSATPLTALVPATITV